MIFSAYNDNSRNVTTETKVEITGKLITKNEFGDKWAFTVESGYVYSINNCAIFKVGDISYGLNGIAIKAGYRDINEIWKDDPNFSGLKIDIGPFIDLALDN